MTLRPLLPLRALRDAELQMQHPAAHARRHRRRAARRQRRHPVNDHILDAAAARARIDQRLEALQLLAKRRRVDQRVVLGNVGVVGHGGEESVSGLEPW